MAEEKRDTLPDLYAAKGELITQSQIVQNKLAQVDQQIAAILNPARVQAPPQ